MRRLPFLILGLAVNLPSFTTIIRSHGYAQFGTLKYPANFQHFDWTNPDAPRDSTLRLMASGSFNTLNPCTLKGASPIGTGDFLQYDVNELSEPLIMGTGLCDPSGDEPASSYDLIAKSVEYTESRSRMVFNLRSEARFHDDGPATASDAAFSYRTLVRQGHPIYHTYLQEVKQVSILTPHRMRFVLRRSSNPLLVLRLGELPMLPQHYWKDRSFRTATFITLLGSGPYRIVEVDPGRRLVFGRVKGWRDEKLPMNRGKYNFDQVAMDFYRDSGVAFEAFKAGELDFYIKYQAKNQLSNYRFPVVLRGDAIRMEILHQISSQTQTLFMNTRYAVFKERAPCQALGEMFDFEWTSHALFSNSYLRSRSYYSNSGFAASGVPEDQEWLYLPPYHKQLPAQLFKQPFSLPTAEECGIPHEILRHVLGLLTDAGWKLFGDRLLDKKGRSLRPEILLVNPSLKRIPQPYRESLANVGIDAHLRTIDRAQYKQRLDQFDYNMILVTLPQILSPGLEQWQYFHSSQVKAKGSKNYAGITNPVVDAMPNRLSGAHSRDEQVATACALNQTSLWQYCSIPNWYLNSHRLACRNRSISVTTPPYTLGLRAWWQKDLEMFR